MREGGAAHGTSASRPLRSLWRDYNLSVVLAALFLASFALQTWTGWRRHVAEQRAHAAPAAWFGDDGYVWTWGMATFENWQFEFLQLLTFVVLTAYLVHKGSHESKDADKRQERQLQRIEEGIRRIEAAETGKPAE